MSNPRIFSLNLPVKVANDKVHPSLLPPLGQTSKQVTPPSGATQSPMQFAKTPKIKEPMLLARTLPQTVVRTDGKSSPLAYSQTEQEAKGAQFYTLQDIEKFLNQRFSSNRAKVVNIITLLRDYRTSAFPNSDTKPEERWTEAEIINALIGRVSFAKNAQDKSVLIEDLQVIQELDAKVNTEIPNLLKVGTVAFDYNQGQRQDFLSTDGQGEHGDYVKSSFLESGVVIPMTSYPGADASTQFTHAISWLEELVNARAKSNPLTLSISIGFSNVRVFYFQGDAIESIEKEIGVRLNSIDPNKITEKSRENLVIGLLKKMPKSDRSAVIKLLVKINDILINPGIREVNFATGNEGKRFIESLYLIFGGHLKFNGVGSLGIDGKPLDNSSGGEGSALGVTYVYQKLDSHPLNGEKYENIKVINEEVLNKLNQNSFYRDGAMALELLQSSSSGDNDYLYVKRLNDQMPEQFKPENITNARSLTGAEAVDAIKRKLVEVYSGKTSESDYSKLIEKIKINESAESDVYDSLRSDNKFSVVISRKDLDRFPFLRSRLVMRTRDLVLSTYGESVVYQLFPRNKSSVRQYSCYYLDANGVLAAGNAGTSFAAPRFKGPAPGAKNNMDAVTFGKFLDTLKP